MPNTETTSNTIQRTGKHNNSMWTNVTRLRHPILSLSLFHSNANERQMKNSRNLIIQFSIHFRSRYSCTAHTAHRLDTMLPAFVSLIFPCFCFCSANQRKRNCQAMVMVATNGAKWNGKNFSMVFCHSLGEELAQLLNFSAFIFGHICAPVREWEWERRKCQKS